MDPQTSSPSPAFPHLLHLTITWPQPADPGGGHHQQGSPRWFAASPQGAPRRTSLRGLGTSPAGLRSSFGLRGWGSRGHAHATLCLLLLLVSPGVSAFSKTLPECPWPTSTHPLHPVTNGPFSASTRVPLLSLSAGVAQGPCPLRARLLSTPSIGAALHGIHDCPPWCPLPETGTPLLLPQLAPLSSLGTRAASPTLPLGLCAPEDSPFPSPSCLEGVASWAVGRRPRAKAPNPLGSLQTLVH